jgi:hypothetical protein
MIDGWRVSMSKKEKKPVDVVGLLHPSGATWYNYAKYIVNNPNCRVKACNKSYSYSGWYFLEVYFKDIKKVPSVLRFWDIDSPIHLVARPRRIFV